MKKGILAGISVVAISAAFWACGSGSVEDLSAGDENALGLYGYGEGVMLGLKTEALKACEEDESCVAKQTGAKPMSADEEDDDDEGDSEDESSESSEPVSSDSKAAASSNSTAITSSAGGSTGGTSSTTVTGNSSASVTGNSSAVITPVGKSSSSSAAASGTGAVKGVCSTTSPIEKGGTATWKFTRMSGAAVETYNWTLNGAATTSSTDASPTATYKKAGEFTAKVVVNKDTESESEITCSTTLKVNGAAISGCKCTPNVTEADLADGEGSASVKWSVSGCASADGSTTFTYAWKDGSTSAGSSSSFTKKFTERTKSYAPTVTISNSDKMTMSPTCTAASIVDSKNPGYSFAAVGSTVSLPDGACVSVAEISSDASFKNVRCYGAYQTSSCSYTMTAGSSTQSVTGVGNCNNSPGVAMSASTIVNGGGLLCLSIEGTSAITCKADNW